MNEQIIDMIFKMVVVILGIFMSVIGFFLSRTFKRQDSMEEELNQTCGALIRVETELAAVKDTQRLTEARFGRVENNLQDVQRHTSGILSSLQHFGSVLERIETQMTSIDQRLSRLEGSKP